MKRGKYIIFFTFLMILSLTLLSSCRKEKKEVDTIIDKDERTEVSGEELTKVPTPTDEMAEEEVTSPGPTATTAPTIAPTGTAYAITTPMPMRDITSAELVNEIKIGWNLGNTMDATDGGNTLNAETSWGNPVTTKEMIDAVKAAGFNTIRIPVSWGNHVSGAPDFTIDKAWLDRVQTIVNYAMEDDMYVIINFHHEEWHFPSYDNLDPAKNQLTKMWAQVADRFKNYDEHLIFEDMNEPRMKGTEYEWTGGTEESRDVINQLNQAFVETIRSSGGNNSLRHLMIPTYAASADLNTWKDFIIPDDGKIIVSVHAYLPYNFTLNGAGTSSWSDDNTNDTKDIDYVMQNLYDAFISKGVPVILGEFGARDKNNLESRTAWAEYYVKRATEKGIPCIIWDNNLFEGNGEKFGLLDRSTLTWKYPEIINALMRGLE